MQVQSAMVPFCGGYLPLCTQGSTENKAGGRQERKPDTQRWAEKRDQVVQGRQCGVMGTMVPDDLLGPRSCPSQGPSLTPALGICILNPTLSKLVLLGICSLQKKHL